MKNYQTPMVVSRMNVREPVAPAAPIALGVGFLTGLAGDDYRPESMNSIKRYNDSIFPAISLFPFPTSHTVGFVSNSIN